MLSALMERTVNPKAPPFLANQDQDLNQMNDRLILPRASQETGSEASILRYGCPETPMMKSLSQGRTWSGEGLTIGISSAYKLREIHFSADTDIIVFLQPGYGGQRAVNSDKVEEFTMVPNDLYWLPTGTDFYSLSTNAKPLLFMNFDRKIRQNFINQASSGAPLDEAVTPISNLTQHALFSTLLRDFVESDGLGGRLRAEALLNVILYEIRSHHSGNQPQKSTQTLSHTDLEDVKAFIEENLDADVSLEVLATLADTSVYSFCRVFKNTTGQSPHQYVNKRRVARASELLATTQTGIAEIAYEVGFSSQSHLTSVFRSAMGTTPAKYRKSL